MVRSAFSQRVCLPLRKPNLSLNHPLFPRDGIIDAITKVCNSPAAETDDTAQEKSENLLKLGHESFPLEYEADFAPLKTAAMPKKVYGRPMKHSEIKLYAVSLLKDFDARSGSMVSPSAFFTVRNIPPLMSLNRRFKTLQVKHSPAY